jgi:hypothetical protein
LKQNEKDLVGLSFRKQLVAKKDPNPNGGTKRWDLGKPNRP